ncbi:antibiotic biosynthesis monooxygenase family protein [Listeria costaricensis]|uniref:antibiotic biosynthesis monooxygenase family protein n=1 Tax=Listeria costaricensis TaxID=2026604 RepID=UPI000C072955|nr:antibiotic biosynthesis monooxygenase [Listeria costaricensis]
MKNMYITTGTEHYLRQILQEHPNEPIILLQNFHQSLLFHESAGPSVFREEATYRELQRQGDIRGFGTVVFEYIMVRDEETPLFLKTVQGLRLHLRDATGFQALILGQSTKNNKFLVVTFWHSERDYQLWKGTKYHKEVIQIMTQNNSQIGFSHIDIYHFPEFSHDSK